ncbi:MAG: MnhB domain-containing protein [Eubacteriales bacterium]|nr:MnhB domain-containing protein [Eubacteriales bacterium]
MNKPEIKNIIQRCGCDKVLPLCLVYICYIVLHGHLSPGGGFQGGVLMVAAVMLVYFAHGYETTVRAFSFDLLHETEALASVFYVALGLLGVAAGAQFAENVLYRAGAAGDLYSSGTIFWMNFAVGVKVITGVGSIALLLLGLLQERDTDPEKEVK